MLIELLRPIFKYLHIMIKYKEELSPGELNNVLGDDTAGIWKLWKETEKETELNYKAGGKIGK